MAGNQHNAPTETAAKTVSEHGSVPENSILPGWLNGFRIQAIIVALLSIAFYANTISNEFAFDDNMVILRNTYVWQGIAGIPDILTKDTYDSYFRQNSSDNVLQGGRYRPLSIITFAIEQEFFGAYGADRADSLSHVAPSYAMTSQHEQRLLHDMHIRHLFNVLWFTLSVVVLLYFLRYIVLKNHPVVALLATIFFVIHPIHTEVVANVKSRDEILSLLFICLTFIFAFKYKELTKKKFLWLALGSYLFAFLSKEYAISLVVLLPLSFYLFNGDTIKKSLTATLPYLAIVALYVFARYQVSPPFSDTVDNTVQNNVYAYASGVQKTATEIATSLNYLRLLLFPHPLSSDYSYNTIAYKDFSHPLVWLSLLVHLSLLGGFFYLLKKRSVLSFAVAFYLLNLLLVCNLLFYIGATMGERLIYHSSIGFSIGLAWLLVRGLQRLKPVNFQAPAFAMFMIVVTGLCGFKTISRNGDWKNMHTLVAQDIRVVPNSFLMNGNMGINYLNVADSEPDSLKSIGYAQVAIGYLGKALSINDVFIQGYVLRGGAYFRLLKMDSALSDLNKIRELNPYYPGLAELYFNVGVVHYKRKQYEQALGPWKQAVELKPGYAKAQNAINTLYSYNLVQRR